MGILSKTGAIQQIGPPASVKTGKLESNSTIYMFQERENLRLKSTVSVDIPISNPTAIILDGTHVDSYFLHFDRKGSAENNGTRLKGDVTFDEKILGLIVSKGRHNATWELLGNDRTTYAINNPQIELHVNDRIEWDEENNKLIVDLKTYKTIDQVRVITEHSVPPTFTSFRLNGSNSNLTISEGNSVSALLQATDPNRDAISFILDGSNIGTDTRESGTRSRSKSLGVFRDNGTFTYRAQARDEDGQSSSTITRTLTVNNVAPTLTVFNLSSNVINEGQSASAFLSATDPGADTISFFLDGSFISTDFRTSGIRSANRNLGTFQDNGVFRFSARARDDDGANSNTITRTLTVNNVAPTITSLTEDFSIRTNNTFSFAATATDPGLTDILVYEWDLDGDGNFDDFTGSSGEWSFSETGDHEVKLRVSDGDGGFDYDSFTVTAVEPKLPEPYSFRFTDIKAVSDDPEGDKFQFSFEIINWTDTPAAGIKIALNEATNLFSVDGQYPEFAGATVDDNGRPLGPNRDPITGNLNIPNNGTVLASDNTAIEWNTGDPILNRDLLGAISSEDAIALVPGSELISGEPRISDIEAVDNGDNVRDGFVFTVDHINESEIISFDLSLLDENGKPINSGSDIYNYGSGVVTLIRSPHKEVTNPDALFINTSVNHPEGTSIPNEPEELFYNNVNRVTEFV